jgi:hypothetical protein
MGATVLDDDVSEDEAARLVAEHHIVALLPIDRRYHGCDLIVELGDGQKLTFWGACDEGPAYWTRLRG